MTTIETFCRVCAEPVDIPVYDSDVDAELMAAMARLGVTCNRCVRPRWQESRLPKKAPHQTEIRATHPDP